jgi:ATP synthase protein I
VTGNQQPSNPDPAFLRQVSVAVARKLRAQRGKQDVWFGLGMSGLVGWSVTIPTVGGAMLGLWLDHRNSGPHSWTLALMAVGLAIGCFNAWHWVMRENKAMNNDDEDEGV